MSERSNIWVQLINISWVVKHNYVVLRCFLSCYMNIVVKTINSIDRLIKILHFNIQNSMMAQLMAMLAVNIVVTAFKLVLHDVLWSINPSDKRVNQLGTESKLPINSYRKWPISHLSVEHRILIRSVNLNWGTLSVH